jgi:riboflavin synthase
VDGVGTVVRRVRREDAVLLDIRVPALVGRLTVLHGSIAVDGVSMTVNALPRRGIVQLSVIPHTLTATTMGSYRVGRRVHLEADQVARFVDRLLSPYRAARRTER